MPQLSMCAAQASSHGRTGWFFAGTDANTGAKALSGRTDQAGCRTWTLNGASYYWCGSGDSGLPGDPGPGSTTTGGGSKPPGHGHPHH